MSEQLWHSWCMLPFFVCFVNVKQVKNTVHRHIIWIINSVITNEGKLLNSEERDQNQSAVWLNRTYHLQGRLVLHGRQTTLWSHYHSTAMLRWMRLLVLLGVSFDGRQKNSVNRQMARKIVRQSIPCIQQPIASSCSNR